MLPKWLAPPAAQFIERLEDVDTEKLLSEVDERRVEGRKTNVRTVKAVLESLGYHEYKLKPPVDKKAEAQAQIWTLVQQTREHESCRCDLRPGMKLDELPLSNSCTQKSAGYICPAVDRYRRLLEG